MSSFDATKIDRALLLKTFPVQDTDRDTTWCPGLPAHPDACDCPDEQRSLPRETQNPKERYGATKPSVGLVPSVGATLAALAMEDGAAKYGPYNFRGTRVEVMTYAHAARRHLDAWVDGEDFTSDTGVPNLAAVIACVSIILDTMALGAAVDNRPPPGATSKMHEAARSWKAAVAKGADPVEAARKLLGPAMGIKP